MGESVDRKVSEQLRKYRKDTGPRAKTVSEFEALEHYGNRGLSHRAALKELDRVKREAFACGERVSSCWMRVE